MGRDGGARRLSRDQSRHGMAARRRTWHAARKRPRGVGWLCAAARGRRQGSARGVWRALPPIALGHAMAVGLVLLAAALAGLIVPLEMMKVIVAGMLMTLGLYRLCRHRHPRYAGMQVTFGTLTVWSFLMASAHGA